MIYDTENTITFEPSLPPWFSSSLAIQDIETSAIEEIIEEAFLKLKQNFPKYQARKDQIQMSKNILLSLLNEEVFVLEAGTGIGKSFAYLIAAMAYSYLKGSRVFISTETKNLQLQLVEKDLPLLTNILAPNFPFEVAYGSANYLCKVRYEETLFHGKHLDLIGETELKKFRQWAQQVFDGEGFGTQFEYPGKISAEFWKGVFRDSDQCPAAKCYHYENCNYYRAKAAWEKARFVVGNHHLLLYNLLNDKRILPPYDALIMDEAHGFQKTAFRVFTLSYSRDFLPEFQNNALRRIKGEDRIPDEKYTETEELFQKASDHWQRFFSFWEVELNLNFEDDKLVLITKPTEYDSVILESTLMELHEHLEQMQENTEEGPLFNFLRGATKSAEKALRFVRAYQKMKFESHVYWAEKKNGNIHLSTCNLKINEELAENFVEPGVWTSATLGFWNKQKAPRSVQELSSGGYFNYFIKEALPVQEMEIRKEIYFSPFDYPNQAGLYIPKHLEAPAFGQGLDLQRKYENKLFEEIRYLTDLSRGGALVLFTSYYLLEACEKYLLEFDLPVLSQSKLGANNALKEFKQDPNSILLGTTSFWQGVDIPGDNLRMLIITKLMFTPPNDPVFQGRCKLIEKQGKNSFMSLSLPEASTMLRQAFGRLIRSEQDKGIVAILDSRLLKKNYGRTLLLNLPPIPLMTSREKLQEIIQERKFFTKYRSPQNE
ncbi:MAG: ATP-dependent DNA helicase [Candidatus Hydrogenedentota bacterium]|nr:MAG: ATP-dependent DNA helicase [Candidatus Hydrogenedentota bacterium]